MSIEGELMSGHSVSFAGLSMLLPADWRDITDDLPHGSPPTLAKADGVGALQFSVGKYKSGVLPDFSVENLKNLLAEFFCTRELGDQVDAMFWNGETIGVRADSRGEQTFFRVWYISNRKDVALITYATSQHMSFSFTAEIVEAEAIATSIGFI